MNLSECKDRARQYYTDLPYHTFDHALAVLDHAETLLDRCHRYDVPVNDDVVRGAVLFHDAGYHRDLSHHGYDSKEAYSAAIAKKELEELGMSPDFIERVAACIISTHRQAPFDLAEEKVVRAADLAGLAADYETFEANSNALRKEHERLEDTTITDEQWCQMMKTTIEGYLQQDIRLTPEHSADGVSTFHQQARTNLNRFIEKHCENHD
ncbi:MAG: hypothetical protein MUP66_03310 [Candidatus Nanohaloarchaeota archaeon QJJ-5]|nr:hypothetical protein [Candidatus Nanohaloarchaeota archaeon QJJ-5]